MAWMGFGVESFLLVGFTGALLHYYKDAHVGYVVYGFVFLSWYAGFLGLVLLPLDISTALQGGDANVHSSLVVGWKMVYWLTFILSWMVLPVLIEYSQSGAFTPEQKLRMSLRYLLRHYAMLLTCGVVLLIYLVVVDHFSINGIVGVAMTLANTYGLLWIIALLGYGLVNIPRRIWTFADPEHHLRETYFRAIQIHDDRVEATFVYEDVVREVRSMLDRFHAIEQSTIILTPEFHHVKHCLGYVVAAVGLNDEQTVESGMKKGPGMPLRPSKRQLSATFAKDESLPTEGEVIALHGRAKRVKADLRRCEQAWQEICWTSEQLSTCAQSRTWRRRALPYSAGLGAAICVVGSAVIMWSEICMGGSPDLSPVGQILLHASPGFGIQLLLLLVLVYMGTCVYQSLFSIRGFGRVALHGAQNSTELSLLTAAVQQCRLQFALGYNFFLLLNCRSVTDRTAFHALFTDMRLIHFFGSGFSLYAPICMVVFAALTFWQGYARLVKSLGLEQYEELIPGHLEHEAKIHQGEALVKKGIEKYAKLRARHVKEASETGGGLTQALLE
ncbi:hypothetical protein Ae201684P_005545 [Aphanomyces euteiches]|uniref:LMBR1-like membrane protein n=1 Tax=Aphanomyces euteiches TaxID=100861 RepID=A0A6G0X4P2_9STRA|nr:hypothetical protein Ae201684_008526 [Aphanomyces euteiches]KAH9085845.1 hypothetical protein Ae201684P_005545 [Aphanomyces euteiches]KAH9143610.1 hypothetical protein AeRB84_012403 [Aphanomyces euteiches]